MTLAPQKSWTAEDLFAMPNDGLERYLIDGELREGGVTVRNFSHSECLVNVASLLHQWKRSGRRPGRVVGGEAGFRLSESPDTVVGIDVAFVADSVVKESEGPTTLVRGAPILAVEIISPSDKDEKIFEKVNTYLSHRVELVWVLYPLVRVVHLHRPLKPVDAFDVSRRLEDMPELPGFSCAVAELF